MYVKVPLLDRSKAEILILRGLKKMGWKHMPPTITVELQLPQIQN